MRSKDAKQPVTVKFVNKTTSKVKLYWIDYKGKFKKSAKIKEGRIEVIDSYEGHKFMAEGKKSSDPVINGNEMFIVRTGHGSHGEVKADITHGPSKNCSLVSKYCFENFNHLIGPFYTSPCYAGPFCNTAQCFSFIARL